ncbi:MAG: signal peptide peptidase SppA [Deltaproteobacteria bacterium]|nr:signal peptide peptidase SppA [Deltaproteobacteria bacterium]
MRTASKIRLLLILLVFSLAIYFVAQRLSLGSPTGPVADGSTLVLELSGRYVEAPGPSALARLAGDDTRPFIGLLSMFSLAERDDRLAAVVLRIRPLDIGWGKADELRESIGRLRAKGVQTIAYLEVQNFSANKELFIASAADEIYVTPGASIPLVGLAAEYVFLGGFWEKLGVEFEVAKAGRYKSAVEIYSERGMSEASREMANSLLDDSYARFAAGLADGRGMTVDAVLAAIDTGSVRNQRLEALGLIDGELHLDQLLDRLGPDVVQHADYAATDPAKLGFEAVADFALIYGTGTVLQGDADGSPFSMSPVFASETVSRAILDAAKDPSIQAIVLRIDSPGGSALASELIWRAIHRARAMGKPIVASFSDVAASGGYYVASAADVIVSDPGTLTGSIGVFALRPMVGGLLEKLEIGVDSLTRGRHADFLLSNEKMSPAAHARLQTSVLDTYQLFLQRVADGRELDVTRVDALAQGRVWTGRQAHEVGLVDTLGGLHAAVREAKLAVGLSPDDDVYLISFPRQKSFSQQLMQAFRQTAVRAAGSASLLPESVRRSWPEPLERVLDFSRALPTGTPLLVPPVLVDIR